jgi:dinuclear metal center YbgI/SA1388 family protein
MNQLQLKHIIAYLETIAATEYQEKYDNAGLLTGNQEDMLTKALITLDCTEQVIDEAIQKGCNLVIAHHPIIFGGLKRLTGKNYVERTVIKAIKHDIAIYAIHTNLDNVAVGVNAKIAELIGVQSPKILAPKTNLLKKLTCFVPHSHQKDLTEALWEAGAGNIGNYSHCSFSTEGTGTYMPNEEANPYQGVKNQLETAPEQRVEVIFPQHLQYAVLTAMKAAHPYEEIAYYLHTLDNEWQQLGSGMVGNLPEAMPEIDFLQHLKTKFKLKTLKYTPLRGKMVKRVAFCGGSGSFLLRNAIAAKADVYVSADFKYHEFFDAENKIVIADIGHYESEIFTKHLLFDSLEAKFKGDYFIISETNTNPVSYL